MQKSTFSGAFLLESKADWLSVPGQPDPHAIHQVNQPARPTLGLSHAFEPGAQCLQAYSVHNR